MASDTTVLLASLCSGGFALAGVAATLFITRTRERARLREEAAMELASLDRVYWSGDWITLQEALTRDQVRLTVAGVPPDLVELQAEICTACWQDLRAHVERTDDVPPGIRAELVDAARSVRAAIRIELLGERNRLHRRRSRRATVTAARQVLGNHLANHVAHDGARDRCYTQMGLIRRR